MRLAKSRLATIVAVGIFLARIMSGSSVQAAEVDEVKCDNVSALSAADSSSATEAVRCLYRRGREALPALVQALRDESQFHGLWCGSRGLGADTIPVEWGSSMPEGRGSMVSEVALYLIEAIVRENQYFAGLCRVHIDGQDSMDLAEIQSRIQKVAKGLELLEPDELRNLSLDELSALQQEHRISFPGHG